jgi:hypothetical protein
MNQSYPKGSSGVYTDVAGNNSASANPATAEGQVAEGNRVMNQADAAKMSPKGVSGTYMDRSEAAQMGEPSIAQNYENKPATPLPPGSTADIGREKP